MVKKPQQTGSAVGQRQDSIVAGRLTIAFSSQFDWNKTADEFDKIIKSLL
jgi:hypothetical protein